MAERRFRISVTRLKLYLDCGRKYFYQYLAPEIPKKTDYPRLCGATVHKLVEQLYKPVKEPRPLYYKDRDSLIGAWSFTWNKNVEEAMEKNQLVSIDDGVRWNYWRVGKQCLEQYYESNVNKKRPLEIEEDYLYPVAPGVDLYGIIDQVREIPLEYIERFRPELIEGGKLKEGYDPVVILDMKTNKLGYDRSLLKKNPDLREQIREQYTLHEDLQATAYTWLYEMVKKKKPVGFWWYHLRSGTYYPTFREDRDYLTLFGVIDHFLENITAESFPKHVDYHCRWCDFLEPCREDRSFFVSRPKFISEELYPLDFQEIENNVKKADAKQLRMKHLVVPRVKKVIPGGVVLNDKQLTIRNLPWDEQEELILA